MTALPEFCRLCLIAQGEAQALADARARELDQLAGLNLGQGRRGHKQYIQVRRSAFPIGPVYWKRNRPAEVDAQRSRRYLSSQSDGW